MKLGKFTKFISSILIASIMMTACSSDNSTPNDNNTQTETPTSIVVAIPQDFDSLDPHKSSAAGTEEVMLNIFTGLVSSTTGGEVIPEIAESFENNDDLTQYIFKLKQNVVFHNGQPLTSKDVKYSFDRLCGKTDDQTTPLSNTYASIINDIETPDDYTVVFNLAKSDAAFLTKMTIAVIPDGSGNTQAETPVGAGPYKFVSYTPGVGITMERNDAYYGDMPSIQTVNFKIFTDTNTAVLALGTGEINMMSITTYDIVPQVPTDKFNVEEFSMNAVQLLALNNEFEPFKDKRVREAINYAVNKDEIISMISPGAPKLGSNFSPAMAYYYQDGLENKYTTDVEKAKELLKEAGYENLSFTCKVASEYPIHVNTAQIIKEQLAKIGVNMEIQTIDWNTWLEDVYKNANHESTIIALTGKIDPDGVLKRFVSSNNRNFVKFNNAEYDSLITGALVEADPAKRVEMYKQAQTILADEAASVFIMDPINFMAIDNRLEGYRSYPFNFIDLRYIKFK